MQLVSLLKLHSFFGVNSPGAALKFWELHPILTYFLRKIALKIANIVLHLEEEKLRQIFENTFYKSVHCTVL